MAGKSKIDDSTLRQLHAEGHHPATIAAQLGVHPGTICYALRKRGLGWERKQGGVSKLTPEQVESICLRYEQGEGATTLAREFGVDKRAIYHHLNQKGVGTRPVAARRRSTTGHTARVSKRDLDITQCYQNGCGIDDIAAQLQIHSSTVRYSLTKQGLLGPEQDSTLKVRQRLRAVAPEDRFQADPGLRHDAFQMLTPEACYWAGFILADGCLSCPPTGNPRLSINLQAADAGHLEKLALWLGTERRPLPYQSHSFGKDHQMVRLQVTSKAIVQRLTEIGVSEGKEGRTVMPSLEASTDFWRGLVDGDGSISPKGNGIYLAGQLGIVDAWARFCDRVCTPATGVVTLRLAPHGGCYVAPVRKREHARLVVKALYGDAVVYLQRKRERAMQEG